MKGSNLSGALGIVLVQQHVHVQTMDIHLAIGQALYVPVFY